MDSPLWRLLESVESESEFHHHPIVVGSRGQADGFIEASSTKRFPKIFELVKEAAGDMTLHVDGAILAIGARRLPAVSAAYGVGTLFANKQAH